jgi:uncharacterized protein (TIGR03382 family)
MIPAALRFLLSLTAVAVTVTAQAQTYPPGDAVAGASKYAQTYTNGGTSGSCLGCHGSAARPTTGFNGKGTTPAGIKSAITGNKGGMGFMSVISNQDLADIAAYIANPNVSTTPVISVSPTSLSFSGSAGTTLTGAVTVSNTGAGSLTLSAITVTGTGYSLDTVNSTCRAGGSVAPGANCRINVNYLNASAAANVAGSLVLNHNATGGSTIISMSATTTAASAPALSVTGGPLSFASTAVGATSAEQLLTLTNTGNAALTLSSVVYSPSDFIATAGTTCVVNSAIAAGSSCRLGVSFRPTVAGTRSGTVSISSNAAGSPASVALSGTATSPAPALNLGSTALNFGSVQTGSTSTLSLTATNTGNAALNFLALSLTGTNATLFSIAPSSTCAVGTPLAAAASCRIDVSFAPSAASAASASLQISSNAPASPASVSLSGTGSATAQAAISLSSTSLSFASTVIGQSAATQTVTVGNPGQAALVISSITLTGAQAAEFSRAGTCTNGSSLAAGTGTCTLVIGFTPTAAGARSASVQIASNASQGTVNLSLAGTGATPTQPALSASSASLNFGSVLVGQSSATQTLTLTNSGTAALSITGVTISSPAFTASATTCTGASVAPAASCTLTLGFSPAAAGAASGSLSLTSNLPAAPAPIALSGTGVAAGSASIGAAPGSLSFAASPVNTAAAAQQITVTNTGPVAVTLDAPRITGTHAADFNVAGGSCSAGLNLAPAASCTASIGFTAQAAGARSASLTLSATGATATVALSGTGTAAAPVGLNVDTGSKIDIGTVLAGSRVVRSITVAASGADILIAGIATTGTAFSIDPSSTCQTTAFMLTAGRTCTVVLVFSAMNDGTNTGTLTINSTAPSGPVAIDLSANVARPNAGSGGCSATGRDGPTDPLLLLLALASALLLWRRRAQARL